MRNLTVILLCLAPVSVQAQILTGTVSVIDGDTLDMGGAHIRLFGIDAPESDQTCRRNGQVWACGAEASSTLRQYVAGKPLTCQGRDTDRYGRLVAQCKVDRLDIGELMITSGYAVAFTKYSDAYVDAEERSKAARAGIWASEFQTPADYRAARTATSAQSNVANTRPGNARRIAQGYGSAKGCVIKGNRNRRGQWIYHVPGMPYYDATRPEDVFCTESEAQAAGYRRAIVKP